MFLQDFGLVDLLPNNYFNRLQVSPHNVRGSSTGINDSRVPNL